ncbi:MAG TPA: hypothetical protein VEY31_14745 [Roseococcus sp.]|nr:hypothetical protein [Roseococcus sp.]
MPPRLSLLLALLVALPGPLAAQEYCDGQLRVESFQSTRSGGPVPKALYSVTLRNLRNEPLSVTVQFTGNAVDRPSPTPRPVPSFGTTQVHLGSQAMNGGVRPLMAQELADSTRIGCR